MVKLEYIAVVLAHVMTVAVRAEYDPFSDNTHFSINFPGRLSEDKELVSSQISDFSHEDDTVILMTKNNEKYKCKIPDTISAKLSQQEAVSNYRGPSEMDLLRVLFEQSSCSYKIEPYWTYELCHGRFLRQYHEEKGTGKEIKLQEYYLGNYRKKVDEKDGETAQGDQEPKKMPPVQQVGGLDLPYFEVNFTDGTACDLTKLFRSTSVHYVCHELGRGEIYELKETSTCEYEVVILTQQLCSHPAYQPKKDPINRIDCHSLDGAPRRPVDMVNQELENTQSRHNQNTQKEFWEPGDEQEGYIEITIGPDGTTYTSEEIDAILEMFSDVIAWEDEFGMPYEDIVDFIKQQISPKVQLQHPPEGESQSKSPSEASSKPQRAASSERSKPNSITRPDKNLLKNFLSGDYCVQGGTGWWKHELCYGKSVTQFHEDNQGKTIINLGLWNEDKHLEWIKSNPNKRPKQLNKAGQIVHHHYSGGDLCELTGKPREVEVKLRCKENSKNPNTMAIYLVEPKTCEYNLVVESPILCPVLAEADDDGLIQYRLT